MKAVNLTFKESEEYLFLWLKTKSSISGYIKDLLIKAKAEEEKKEYKTMTGFLSFKDNNDN